jgi:hypothetical protein
MAVASDDFSAEAVTNQLILAATGRQGGVSC